MKKKLTILTIIIVTIIVCVNNKKIQKSIMKEFYPFEYSEYVNSYSEEYNVDPLLTFAIIKSESNFNPNSISQSGAKGLMQLMDTTAEEISVKINIEQNYDIFKPETNIKIGTKYISTLLQYYNNNIYLSLAAYNAGIGNVNKWIENNTIKSDGSDIENIPYKETRNYVRKVVRDYRIYKEIKE